MPYVEKFSLEVETLFEPDNGCQVGLEGEGSVWCVVCEAMPRGRALSGGVASRGHSALIKLLVRRK